LQFNVDLIMTEFGERFNIKRLNWLLILIFFVGVAIAIIYDVILFQNGNGSLSLLRIWFLDNDLAEDWGPKGMAMLISSIIGLFATGIYFYVGRRLLINRKDKKDPYLISLVYFSTLYFGCARLIEIFYAVSDSDLHAVVYNMGDFWLPIDVMGIILYLLFIYEVFIHVYKTTEHNWNLIMKRIYYLAFVLSCSSLATYYLGRNNPIDVGVAIISYMLLAFVLVIVIQLYRKVLHVRELVDENKAALMYIAIQILLFILIFVFTVPAILIDDPYMIYAYSFRAVKNVLFCIHALLYIPAFIRPFQKSKKEHGSN
jgi:hypothetical protein